MIRVPTFVEFTREEDGSGTVHSLYWLIAMIMVASVAIDGSNAWRVKHQTQVAADAAALAAARHLDDTDRAREVAMEVAELNINRNLLGEILRPEDVSFGTYDDATGLFKLDDPSDDEMPTHVKVDAVRDTARNNPINNFLLGIVGADTMSLRASSVASSTSLPPEVEEMRPTCTDSFIITEGRIQTGGGNEVAGRHCFHGADGLQTGGGDFWQGEVMFSAENIDTITINSFSMASLPEDQMKEERTVEAVVLPQVDTLFDTMWTAFENAGGTYEGDLVPAPINDGNPMTVEVIDEGWWTIQADDITPGTIYLVNHGAQFAGNVDAQDIVILAKGQIGIGGGSDLVFQDIMLYGEGDLNFSGDIGWGRQDYCSQGRFDTYLLSKTRIGLGGWGGGGHLHGTVIAAPTVQPGGAMRSAGGVHIEATYDINLGGAMRLLDDSRCAAGALDSHFDIVYPMVEGTPPEEEQVRTSRLAR